MRLSEVLKRFFKGILSGIEDSGVDVIEQELKELEGTYALLLLGSFIGLPAPPSFCGAFSFAVS